jgi:quercetin dioxygenase-like cupin family protein
MDDIKNQAAGEDLRARGLALAGLVQYQAGAVRSGEMIIMPAHKPHALMAASRFKMLLIMIRT